MGTPTSTMVFCRLTLEENQQALFQSFGGERSTSDGPGFVFYSCLTTLEERRDATILQKGQYCIVLNDADASRRAVYGPVVDWLAPREKLLAPGIQSCPTLTREEYIVVHNTIEGTKRNELGPALFKPGAFDVCSAKQTALNLAKNEYVKIKDEHGKLRVERGEKRVVPEPLEEVIDQHVNQGVKKAVNIDEHHAVQLRNEDVGTVELKTDHGLFIPGPYQEDIQVQKKIILESYERMVYKDMTGKFVYVSGASENRNFFLPPFCEVVTQEWSTDLKKEHDTFERVWRFDMRPSYMNYEFNCRTIDNVELVVDVSFYWQILDVKAMIERTADAPGDICTHARSMIIQAVSNITLMTFLEKFNDIIRAGAGVGKGEDVVPDPFYIDRGVELLSVEVLQFKCSNPDTDKTLQAIIRETAERLKKKENQKGENEVAISKLEGEIEQEKLNKQLIEIKKSHLKTESRIEGEAEYHKVVAFLGGVTGVGADEVKVPLEEAVTIYQMLRKLDSVKHLSESNSTLYLTPDDVNLSVGTMYPVSGPQKESKKAWK